MEQLDPSTKKQLNLLLAKISGTPKQVKPIVSTVPIAQIRKSMLKDHSAEPTTPEIARIGSPVSKSSTSTSPIHKSRLSPSKSNYELSRTPTSAIKRSPIKSAYDFSTPSKSTSNINSRPLEDDLSSADVPMDEISIRPSSPLKQQTCDGGTPMEIDTVDTVASCDVFMDAQSCDNLNEFDESPNEKDKINENGHFSHSSVTFDESEAEAEEDEEVILNVSNVIKSSTPTTPLVKEIDDLTTELPLKIQLELKKRLSNNCNSPLKSKITSPSPSSLPHSASTPSVSSRIKSLGLAAGTPLRAIFRNATEAELLSSNNFKMKPIGNSLLTDLIEEFCNSKDENCFKKIVSLTANRSGDFDGLSSEIVHKLFISTSDLTSFSTEIKFKLLTNFLQNESFLLSQSGREIIEILEEAQGSNFESETTIKFVCKSNLVQILIENCIELCCERISEFKLIFLAECIKNFIGSNFVEIFNKSISPLLLVTIYLDQIYINSYCTLTFRP